MATREVDVNVKLAIHLLLVVVVAVKYPTRNLKVGYKWGSLNLPKGRSTLGNEPMLLDVSWVDLPCVSSN